MKKAILLFVLILSSMMMAQYQQVTIKDVQFLPDSIIANGDAPSPMLGDTVIITAVCMVAPVVDPINDRRPNGWAGSRWFTYAQMSGENEWAGVSFIQNDTTGDNQLTGFQNLDTADVFQVVAVVDEYYTTTQMAVLLDPISEVEVIQTLAQRPAPIQLSISDFMEGGIMKHDAEKYEGMYVEIREGFTSDRNSSEGTFTINDGEGNQVFMYNRSGYFTQDDHRLTGLTDYEAPLDGSQIVYIRGFVETWDSGYRIAPMYPGDLEVSFEAPNVQSLERNMAYAGPTDAVEISSRILEGAATIDTCWVFYSVNGAAYDSVLMAQDTGNDTLWTGSIPAIGSSDVDVKYFVKAKDAEGISSTNPYDTSYARYFYLVRDGDLAIQDVQYSPYGTGYSSLNGFEVTVQGIVTAGPADYDEAYIYIQNGTGAWSGVMLFGAATESLVMGDLVEVTGIVNESYSVTRLGNIDNPVSVNVLSSGNELPAAVELSTGDIGTVGNGTVAAEQYESVLVKYTNATCTAQNADGSGGNYGESLFSDGSGDTRVELQDGVHMYHNLWESGLADSTNLVEISNGDTFDSLTGVLFFSYSNYKLNPRTNADFVGGPSDVEELDQTVETYSLAQNYPNPFNPETTIEFSIPEASNVKLSVFDILGREVTTLVNEFKSAGAYRAKFNAAKLASGLYLYRIEAGNFVSVKKMMLLK